jgi:hypothetical protein
LTATKNVVRNISKGESIMKKMMVFTAFSMFLCYGLLFSIGCASRKPAVKAGASPASKPVAVDRTVAIVNGQPIKASELDAHVSTTKLAREEALEDLIDLCLTRVAVAANRVSAPAEPWSPEVRAKVELDLAKALGVDIPPPRVSLVVDHAWLKDVKSQKVRAAGRALLVRLRNLVKAGATIPEGYTKLKVADGSAWHIGDHEEYPYSRLPAKMRDLPPGSLSEIIPGDGGLHLFKIYQRKDQPPSAEEIRAPLRTRLRSDASIERPETPTQ